MSDWKLFLLSFAILVSFSSFAEPVNHFSEQAESMRDQVVTQIQDIIPKVSAAKKAALYFRLGETYQAKANYAYAKEYLQFDVDYQKWFEASSKGVEPKLSDYLFKSAELRKLAITQYQTLLRDYPDYSRLDEVLYTLGYYRSESGDKSLALQNYLTLIERFPNSIYIADAYLATGDHYFHENNAQKAYDAYAQAFRLGMLEKKTAIYMYALYKQAWCDYNENRFENALQKFKRVVILSQEARARQETLKTQGKDAVQLGQEALKDTVRIFAQLGQIEEAYQYFKSNLAEDEAALWMTKLANTLQKQGQYQEEVATYVFLQKLSNNKANFSSYEIAILKAFVILEDKKNINLHAVILAKFCAENKSPECDEAEVLLRNLASKYHRFANQSKSQEDYQVAQQLYEAYLSKFPQSEHLEEMQFFLGELLWEVGQWELAASYYDLVFQKKSEKIFVKTSGINAVVTWENVVSHEERPHFLLGKLVSPAKNSSLPTNIVFKKEENLKPIDISAEAQNLINAIDRFTQFSKSNLLSEHEKEKSAEWAFKAALIYQRNFHFEEAQKRFDELIRQSPNAKQSMKAAMLILDGLEARQNWEGLSQAAQLFLQERNFLTDKQIRLQVAQFEEGARFNAILKAYENLPPVKDAGAAKDDAEGLASRFEQFFKEFPHSQYAMKSLYNAAIIYSQIPRYDLCAPLAEQWISLFKTRGLRDIESKQMAGTLLLLLASIYEKTALWEKADQIENAMAVCQTVVPLNAFCSYLLLEGAFHAYQKIKMNAPLAQIKKQIQKKENKMAVLIKSYLHILDYKDAEWGMRSLYRVAEIQLDYVKSLRAISNLKSLSEEAKQLFLQELSKIISPVEAEAILTLEKALEKAEELGLSSPVVQEIRKRLSEIVVNGPEISKGQG